MIVLAFLNLWLGDDWKLSAFVAGSAVFMAGAFWIARRRH
jgi:hypothetical protein